MVEQDVAPEKAVEEYLWAQNVIHYILLSGVKRVTKNDRHHVCAIL